jgi:hypothetical protein
LKKTIIAVLSLLSLNISCVSGEALRNKVLLDIQPKMNALSESNGMVPLELGDYLSYCSPYEKSYNRITWFVGSSAFVSGLSGAGAGLADNQRSATFDSVLGIISLAAGAITAGATTTIGNKSDALALCKTEAQKQYQRSLSQLPEPASIPHQ